MKTIFFVAALLLALPAHADWIQVGETETLTVFIESDTIKKTGPTLRAWAKTEY